jgi:hypothetical protein
MVCMPPLALALGCSVQPISTQTESASANTFTV